MAVNVDDNTTINGENYTTSDAIPHREAFTHPRARRTRSHNVPGIPAT